MEPKSIKKTAYQHLSSGLHCAEAVVKTIVEQYQPLGDDLLMAASALGGGIVGSSRHLCGAFSGGVLAAGALLGRRQGGEDLHRCAELVKRFEERFLAEFGSLNCSELMRGWAAHDDGMGCARLSAKSAVILAELLSEMEQRLCLPLAELACQPRQAVALGSCPFSPAA